MFEIIKSCHKHGALTINDVYIRNTRKGMDCKFCNKEYKFNKRIKDPEKFKEHGRKYRYIELSPEINSRICSGCKKELSKELFSNSDWKLRYCYCKLCRSKANFKSKIKNKNTYEQYKFKAAISSRKSYLKKAWGINLDEFNALVDKQNGLCGICQIKADIFHIDHNHQTGKIRSLLCSNCNRGIGYLKESPVILQSAINYINHHLNN